VAGAASIAELQAEPGASPEVEASKELLVQLRVLGRATEEADVHLEAIRIRTHASEHHRDVVRLGQQALR
jgi:hypothetical protein